MVKILYPIFLIIDFFSPVWMTFMIIICRRKGFRLWQAWGITSTLYLSQAYLGAKFIGYNIGGYVLALVTSLPFLFLNEIAPEGSIFNSQSELWLWTIPPVILILIPMFGLFAISKVIKKKNHGVRS